MTTPAAPHRQHKPVYTADRYRQRCEKCGAIREVDRKGQPIGKWWRKGTPRPWCPGPPTEVTP